MLLAQPRNVPCAPPFAPQGRCAFGVLAGVHQRSQVCEDRRPFDGPSGGFARATEVLRFSRGMARNSQGSVLPGIKARIEGVGSDTLRWTSKFGSAAIVSFEGSTTDGLNEKGLAAHLLVLDESQLEAPINGPYYPMRIGLNMSWTTLQP